mmetsp:Transcript_13245/g.31584  ORF Transcript_13245/g.31584 Transcript_13245/m.31584 type:complete len:208 (+) Transcript_13245:1600-2223(+)
MGMTVEAVVAGGRNVEGRPMHAVLGYLVASGVLGRQADTIDGGGRCCGGGACGCCCWLASIDLVWKSMTIALLHLCIANVASSTRDCGAELPQLQVFHGDVIARRVRRLNACVWLAARDAVRQSVVVALSHFGSSVIQCRTLRRHVPLVQLGARLGDHVALGACWGLAVDIFGTAVNCVGQLLSGAHLHMGMADVSRIVALHHHVET